MSSGFAILQGAKNLDKVLQKKFLAAARRELVKSSHEGAQQVLVAAQSRAPVGDTGKLWAGLNVERHTGKMRPGQIRGWRVSTGTREEMGIDAKAKGYYPAAVEFGYKTKGGGHVAPRSYLRAGLLACESVVIAITGGRLRRMITSFQTRTGADMS